MDSITINNLMIKALNENTKATIKNTEAIKTEEIEERIEQWGNVILKFDNKGRIIYSKDKNNGYEKWNKYDKNNNLIHCKSSDGDEFCFEYDENNNMIKITGKDKEGRIIYLRDINGKEHWYKHVDNKKIGITEKEYKYIEKYKQYKKDNKIQ